MWSLVHYFESSFTTCFKPRLSAFRWLDVISSAKVVADKNSTSNFVGHGLMKIRDLFSSALEADENTDKYFRRPFIGRRKYRYFRRLLTKKRLFSSTLFRQPNFVGGPTKIAIFVGIVPIFVGFWPTKISYFPVVSSPSSSGHQRPHVPRLVTSRPMVVAMRRQRWRSEAGGRWRWR
jgi:hypothetical protein